MLFTGPSSERVVNALSKIGFKVIKQGKHIGMFDSFHKLTIPKHKRIISICCGKLYFCFFCRVRFPNEPLLKAVWETASTFLIGNSFSQ